MRTKSESQPHSSPVTSIITRWSCSVRPKKDVLICGFTEIGWQGDLHSLLGGGGGDTSYTYYQHVALTSFPGAGYVRVLVTPLF